MSLSSLVARSQYDDDDDDEDDDDHGPTLIEVFTLHDAVFLF